MAPLKTFLSRMMSHPLARGRDIDAPETTAQRRRIIRRKPYLQRLYRSWYRDLAAALPEGPKPALEVGTGAGFLGQYLPNLITSDRLHYPGIGLTLDGQHLPLPKASLRGMVLINVLHHIPRPAHFLQEAGRCVEPGGKLAMIEPWNTPWSRLIYSHLHHEPFLPDASSWRTPGNGPLSGANGALPWMIFSRDRGQFEVECPSWEIEDIVPHTALQYLCSGGLTYRSLLPGWAFPITQVIEQVLTPWAAMFALITLRRT